MRQKSGIHKATSEKVVKDIRRATRKQYSAEEKILVGLEGAVGEVGLSQELPEVLDRVQLGRSRGKEEQGDVVRHLQLAGGVPSGAIEQEDGVGVGYDVAGDLRQMGLHGVDVGPR